jgi:signal transduction histidine kinase
MYTLSEQIKNQKIGDHICLVYESREEQMAAIVPFISQGIERNEACVYIVDDRATSDVKDALSRSGLDVDDLIRSGALTFATKRDSYLRSGIFDPKLMIEFCRESVEAAVAQGFTGYRITGEMTWALGNECGCDRLMEYETLLNEFFPTSKALALCQYNRHRFSPEMIRDVLRTHPVAILGEKVCPNLYYETPDMILGKASAAKRVDHMIDNLTRFRTNELVLQEAVQARDEFLSIASHELKTPLTSLKFEAYSIGKQIERQGSVPVKRVKQSLSLTDRQVNRLSKLIDSLLDVSKINSGKFELEAQDVDLVELVSSCVDRMAEQSLEKGASIEVKGSAIAESSSITGQWDRLRIEQVITNLLTNSIKYGEGKPIEVELQSDGEKAFVTVRDQGIGIATQDQERIFERFERAISANSVSGFGLGLFIVKEIVDAHRGSIRVDSAPGKGSAFVVELPL